jgi:hypothetical protein
MPIAIYADPPLAPTSDMCVDIVRQALADARPEGEAWVVMIYGADQQVTHFDFRRGLKAPKCLTLMLQDADASRALVYGSVCRLLRREWPGALAAH